MPDFIILSQSMCVSLSFKIIRSETEDSLSGCDTGLFTVQVLMETLLDNEFYKRVFPVFIIFLAQGLF